MPNGQPKASPDRRRAGVQTAVLLGLSLLLALLYWAYNVYEEKALKDLSVPIEFVNVPQDMAVVAEGVPRLVTVEVKGSPEMLKRIREEDVDAKVDVAKLTSGPQVFEIGRESVRLPSAVELVRVVPRVIHFSLERKTRATVPLEPSFSGHSGRGLQVLSWKIEPPSVRVEGPESLLRRLKRVPTQPVPLDGRTQDFQVPVVPVVSDSDLSVLDTGPFALLVVLGERRLQRMIGPVSLLLVNGRFPVAVDPQAIHVMVEGPASLVSGLTPQDLAAELDLGVVEAGGPAVKLRPAVRFADPAVGARVEITSWSERYVEVTPERGTHAVPAGGPP